MELLKSIPEKLEDLAEGPVQLKFDSSISYTVTGITPSVPAKVYRQGSLPVCSLTATENSTRSTQMLHGL
jgi:hypothetical protein